MDFLTYVLTGVIFLNVYCYGNEIEYDVRLKIKLDHSLDYTPTPVYFHRGDISSKSIQSGVAIIDEFKLTNEQISSLKKLAEKNGNYRLRATATTNDGKENYYYAFVKACSLIDNELNNLISVNLDHNGNIIAVNLAVPNICLGNKIPGSALTTFNTSVEVRHMEFAPLPDTATYIQKLEREREAKERGETKDNRSFLAKYWMYLVPIVIIMLLPSATNQESGGGAAQR